MKKSFYIFVILFLLSLGGGFYLRFANSPEAVLDKYTKRVQNQLNEDYKDAISEISKPSFRQLAFESDSSNSFHLSEFHKLYAKPYTLLAYEDGHLKKWFNNKLFLPDSIFNLLPDASFHQLPNAYAYVIKKELKPSNGHNRQAVAIIPIKYNYQISKLKSANTFRADPDIPLTIQVNNHQGVHKITGPANGQLFLSANGDFQDTPTQKGLIFFFGMAFFLFLTIANQIANKLSQNSPVKGTIFLLSILTVITIFLYLFDPASQLNGLGFLAETLQIKVLNSSLAVLLFNSITFVWLMIYLNKTYVFKENKNLKRWQKFIISITLNIGLMTGIVFVLEIYKQIIISSNISINFLTILQHKLDSVLGLAVMIILLAALVLFALWMIKFINQLDLGRYERAFCITAAFAIVLAALLITDSPYRNSILYGSAILLPFALDFYITDKTRKEPYEIYIWFGLTSLFAAVALNSFQYSREIIEMQTYSKVLSEERDTVAEREVLAKVDDIIFDPNWDSIYAPLPYYYDYDKAQLLLLNHFQSSKYLTNNFSSNFFLFSDNGPSFKDQLLTEAEYRNKIANATEIYPYEGLYLLNNPDGGFSYFIERNIRIKDIDETLVIELKSEILGNENINSPIFSSNTEFVKLKNIGNYEFATFKGNNCIRRKGSIQNEYYAMKEIPPLGQGKEFKKGAYIEYLYHSPNGNVVLIKRKTGGLMQFLSLFAMLFFLISTLSILANIANHILHFIPDGLQLKLLPGHSFYAKIQSGFLALIYVSFFFIGIVTAVHFNTSNKHYHNKRLLRKSRAIHTALNYSLLDLPNTAPIKKLQAKVEAQIEPLSIIHKMDAINFYNLDGKLIFSSKSEIFLKGVVPPEMDAYAYNYLSKRISAQQINKEQIGNVHFKSSYFPIKHAGDLIGYLGIPYYTKKQARLNDLNDFVSRLLIAYIALFIIALTLIVAGSRLLAKPIRRLSNAIRLNTTEPIVWDDDDEFKDFVEVYNESLREKENHHQLMIKMEKESAWRDMAKQVAHDIKNPLTPIQLHIQHFQRSIHDRKMDMDQIEERTDRVTNIILTQINSLLRKVANFQDVANVAEGSREQVSLNKILKDIVLLHENENNMDVLLKLTDETVYVYGNKGQIERIFGNLVKNAIQAIPQDRYGTILISLSIEDKFAVVRVSDNGSGIPEHMTNKVFTPNFTTKNSGTGLGLHICKSIVENHQGMIDFVTERGEGTTFTVRLKPSRIKSNLEPTPA